MNVKKVIVLGSMALLLSSQGIVGPMAIQAAEEMRVGSTDNILRWANASRVAVDLSFDGGKAECTGIVYGKSGTTKISATFTLERKNANGTYTHVTSWYTSTSGLSLNFFEATSVSSGYTYRLKVSASVTCNGTTETVSTSVERSY